MDARVATRYLLALTHQIADLTAELADLRAQPVPLSEDRRQAIALLQALLRLARRKRALLLADPFFPRAAAPRPELCHVPAVVPARHTAALARSAR